MGGMGGAQPLAATMTGAAFLGIEVDPERIKKRLKTGYCDFMVNYARRSAAHPEERRPQKGKHLRRAGRQLRRRHSRARRARRGARHSHRPDSAHDPLNGYVPNGMTLEAGAGAARERSEGVRERSLDAMARHVEGMLQAAEDGLGHLRLRQQHSHVRLRARREERVRFPRIRARLHSSAVLRRPRSVPLGGAFAATLPTSHVTDDLVLADVPARTQILSRWIDLARKRIKFQGLPSRICWLGYGERAEFGLAINDLVKSGQDQGADRHRTRSSRLRLGRLALPRNREHEGR